MAMSASRLLLLAASTARDQMSGEAGGSSIPVRHEACPLTAGGLVIHAVCGKNPVHAQALAAR